MFTEFSPQANQNFGEPTRAAQTLEHEKFWEKPLCSGA